MGLLFYDFQTGVETPPASSSGSVSLWTERTECEFHLSYSRRFTAATLTVPKLGIFVAQSVVLVT
jgi:hypothetical protein